jgi:hypothetical protein
MTPPFQAVEMIPHRAKINSAKTNVDEQTLEEMPGLIFEP